ncbi:uncharacterized protein BDV14DRAFT_182439 [Aspergillus stella-maris]|uniref:uncharacterized protein n=1 Tax=Aspergillus stella-maris TaxID=1810926 RepID=UPI003CCD45E8
MACSWCLRSYRSVWWFGLVVGVAVKQDNRVPLEGFRWVLGYFEYVESSDRVRTMFHLLQWAVQPTIRTFDLDTALAFYA